MKSREQIIRETFEIVEQLSMFGVLKMWWVAKHVRGIEQKGKREAK